MELLIGLPSPGSLITCLNCILVGVVIFYSIDKFSNLVEVAIYALAETLIPLITRMFLGSVLGFNAGMDFGSILLLFIIHFIIGFLVIKLTKKITDYFNSDTIIYFIIAFSIIDFLVIQGVILILGLLLKMLGG